MPTRLGVVLTVAGCAVLAAGCLLGYGSLVVLGCAAVLAQLTGVITVAWRPPTDLVRDLSSQRVVRGDPAVCVLTVSAPSRWPVPKSVAVDRVGLREVAVAVPALRPYGVSTVTYRLDTERRGVFTVGPLRRRRGDLFGLAQATRWEGEPATLWVHPRTYPFAVVPAGRSRHLEGPVADTALARSITFHRLRDYVPGDDLRHVHWRSTARTGQLMVREYIDTSLPATTVLLDTGTAAYAGRQAFEEAIEVAASAVNAAVRGGFPTALGTAGAYTEGPAFLDRLAEVEQDGDGGLPALAELLPPAPAGGMLIAVTGKVTPSDAALLHRLAQAYDHAVLFLLGDRAAPISTGGNLTVLSAADAVEACATWNAHAAALR